MSFDVAAQLCAAAGDLGLTPFVRVPERDYGTIGRLLDGGAQGIVAPRVETVAEAETISRACRFPPRGQRSQIAMVPQLGMRPTPAAELNPALDAQMIVQILLETPAGIANADAIAARRRRRHARDRRQRPDRRARRARATTATRACATPVVAAAEACARHGKLLMLGGSATSARALSRSARARCG